MKYRYWIDLDERGSFRAHVEEYDTGVVVFNILAGNELEEDESSVFEDGYMKHPRDVSGLKEHLVDLLIMQKSDTLEILP